MTTPAPGPAAEPSLNPRQAARDRAPGPGVLADGAAGQRRPTMRDVASRAGVSFKTVSRVVNNEAGVSATVTAKVDRAIAELGFRPHSGASSLRRAGGRTDTIALLLDNIGNSFSSAVLRAVEVVASARDVVVLAASVTTDERRELALVRSFVTRRVDGLIVMPASQDHSYLAPEQRAGLPVVLVDRAPSGVAADCVVTTNLTGSNDAVRHLIAHGHRRIAFLGDDPSLFTARERQRGYEQALDDAGIPLDPTIVVTGLRSDSLAGGATTRLLTGPHPPTALFTARNAISVGAIRALRQLGRQQEVALIGFDDFPMADLLEPAITVVAQDPAMVGRQAAETLFARMDGDPSPFAEHVVATRLIRRGSGEIRPPQAER